LRVHSDDESIEPGVRALTFHPGTPVTVRRALVTFPYDFTDRTEHVFTLSLHNTAPVAQADTFPLNLGGTAIDVTGEGLQIKRGDSEWRAALIAPEPAGQTQPRIETVEWNAHYRWVRLLYPDETWPRIVEIRLDALGTVVVQSHLQRLESGDATVPDYGWHIEGDAFALSETHRLTDGDPFSITAVSGDTALSFPLPHSQRRGEITPVDNGVRYLRCRADEQVPFQEAAWRRAAFVLGTPNHTPVNALLEPELNVTVDAGAYAQLYPSGLPSDLARWPALDHLREYTRDAIVKAAAVGDDFGNVTSFAPGQDHGGYYGMNRLNHGPSIFRTYWRSGDQRLRETAVQWCNNMHDLSLWWGDKDDFGGTRYNNAVAAGDKTHEGDTSFMWRTNWASHFCTKGYDSFLYAYEETGDPRMLAALDAQVAYAREHIHTNTGECRNIGDVADFMNLYQCTGVPMYRDEGLRLFRELRDKLGDNHLFSQGGQPILEDGPFIDNDAQGTKYPFAKPYIMGYALAGLPDLLEVLPDEPRLHETVRAVGDFMARSQDPTGGWRYPDPASSYTIIHQGLEHAMQLVRAGQVLAQRGEPIDAYLNAIERTLQSRVAAYRKSGKILSGLAGWEQSTGALEDGQTLHDRYAKPHDRDKSRDYTEGTVGVGGAPPDGLVYFEEVLAFYLAHRPAERLFNLNAQANQVVDRVPDTRIRLTPLEKGSFLRMERPENPAVGFTLWAPEWVTFPSLGYGPEELGGMKLDWQRDETTGAVQFRIERDEASFTASFTPYADYVACDYTVWPNPDAEVPATWGVGPCQQMKAGVFESEEADLLNRLWFVSKDRWTRLGAHVDGNPRNVQYVQGHASHDMTGGMLENGWRTLHDPRPDAPLIACTSTDGQWVAATAAEFSNSVCNNAGASHRCVHSQGSMPLRKDGPTTLRVHAYLMKGSLDDLRNRYEADRARWKQAPPHPPVAIEQNMDYGMRALLPSLHDAQVPRMNFPLAWRGEGNFADWRTEARKAYLAHLSTPPPRTDFAAQVVATERRDGYEVRKIALNLSADTRVLAYLLVPDSPGPHPAAIALHDHGAHFSIGKEKVIRPFGVSDERAADARDWANKYYGGRHIGDVLAKRGYVVFATDALFWGDRGRREGVAYEAQQALGANLLQLGMSWAGTIVWDDIRSAEFVQSLPEVDPSRIGCVGLSMGANRSWHLAAATDIVRAGAAICWMSDTPSLMSEGNNQTRGQSAFSMIHPGLRRLLDYPDVASIACPKPMLFYNGTEDGLFPVDGVERAFGKMRSVWESKEAGDVLETRLWPVSHEFNTEMQEDAFAWLDRQLLP
jgi:dienelactone hydrolase